MNRGRRSEQADALIEGFRPGVMERLGLGPTRCLARNPKLVYGRMTGWGQDGPYAQRAGHDINYIALAGALHAIGRKGEAPVPPLNLVGDFGGGGMLLAFGVVRAARGAALGQGPGRRRRDGRRRALLMTMFHGLPKTWAWEDERGTNLLDTGAHFYDVYETADGKYVSIGSIEPQFYAELLRLTGSRRELRTADGRKRVARAEGAHRRDLQDEDARRVVRDHGAHRRLLRAGAVVPERGAEAPAQRRARHVRAVLMAYASGGPVAAAFAATRPERTLALILYAAMAASRPDDDVTWAWSDEQRAEAFGEFAKVWGTGANIDRLAPSAADDERVRAWLGRLERQSLSPAALIRVGAMHASFDVKPLLASIRVPTLVLHRVGDEMVDPRHSYFLAERIPGAKHVELPGADNLAMVGDTESLLGEVEDFLTGGRRSGEPDRELLTVLFTDIVDATPTASRLGDARWRALLADHDKSVRAELDRYGGVEVKTIGDAFLATFSGPPSQAARCARSILAAAQRLGIELRCGLHTGECEHIGGDVGGMAVHIAARVSALAGPNEVLASGTTYGTVVGSGLDWTYRGEERLKGVPGSWPLFVLDA
jgi:class 3 adenylate cyclase